MDESVSWSSMLLRPNQFTSFVESLKPKFHSSLDIPKGGGTRSLKNHYHGLCRMLEWSSCFCPKICENPKERSWRKIDWVCICVRWIVVWFWVEILCFIRTEDILYNAWNWPDWTLTLTFSYLQERFQKLYQFLLYGSFLNFSNTICSKRDSSCFQLGQS